MKKTIYLIALLLLAGCKKEEVVKEPANNESPKLAYFTETFILEGFGIQSLQKTQYEYDSSGKLYKYSVSDSNAASGAFEEQRYVLFTNESGQVRKLEEYLTGINIPHIRTVYEYGPDGRVSKITETNYGAGVTSEASFNYGSADDSVKIHYSYSNGASSEYEFSYTGQNIQHDKTISGGELCNDGTYTYDTKVNPFHNLGYVDFALTNFSVNNLLTATVDYVGCSTPTFVQDTRVYEYNDNGYPTLVTTTYKNDNRLTSEKRFYYKVGN